MIGEKKANKKTVNMVNDYLRRNALKELAICVSIVYCCLFFLPNAILYPQLINRDRGNSVVSKIFNAPEDLFSAPPRIGISGHSLCKFAKLTLFKEASIVSVLSDLFFYRITPSECLTLNLAKIIPCYSLAPPIA